MTAKIGLMQRFSGAGKLEFEQAAIRLVLAGMIAAYVAWYTTRQSSSNGAVAFALASAYLAAAIVIFLTIWAWPGPSVIRRVLVIVVDVTVATCCLWALGEGGVVIVGLYLFIILGNGFRYGRKYLYITQALSIAGFAFVIFAGSWWSQHTVIAMGLLYILIIIPFYVGALAERMRLNAQRELEDCRRTHGGGGSEQSSEVPGG